MMSGSSSESEVELISSQKTAPVEYDKVPHTQEIKMRLFGGQCSKKSGTKLCFKLLEGKDLPYHTTAITKKKKVLEISFSKNLSPSVIGYSGVLDEDWWIFNEEPVDKTDDDLETQTQSSLGEPSHPASPSKSPTRSASPGPPSRTASPGPPLAPTTPTTPTTPVARPSDLLSPTVYKNPDWLRELKATFKPEIIDVCSVKAREAAEANKYIEDDGEFVRIRSEIVNSVLAKLKKIYGNASNPGKDIMQEMIILLSYEYPRMFRECEAGDDHRKVEGFGRQASLMRDRYREQRRREVKADLKRRAEDRGPALTDEEDNVELAPDAKKGKQKNIYGVVNAKWHKKVKVSPQARMMLSQTNGEPEFEKREAIFASNRAVLCSEFRSSQGKRVGNICKPFFMDPRHLANQFSFVTDSPPLLDNIENNFRTFMEHLELYVKDADRSVEARRRLREIETKCEIELQGSTTLRDLHILTWASEHFDRADRCQFIRMSEDHPTEDPSPHLVAVLVDKSYIFELWTENDKLLGNMDLFTALAAFFHLCFTFDLKYPKDGQTISDLIQRRVCKYGDDSGTRTWKRRDSAVNKIEHFCSRVYRLTN